MTEDVWKQINAADNPRALWRGGLAVKQPWNQNGQYIKYTHNKARDGEVVVWEGPASAQFLGKNKNPSKGYYEGGLNQLRFQPLQQIRDAKKDTFTDKIRAPDMVEGGAMDAWYRREINDPRIDGPHDTGWGYKDFDDQHDLIGLPLPTSTP